MSELRQLTDQLIAKDYELKRDYRFLNAVVDHISAMILVFDFFGRVIMMNPECVQCIGYTAKELNKETKFFNDVILESERIGVAEVFRLIVTTRRPSTYINRVKTKSGSIKVISWRNSVVALGDGRELVIAFGIDITNQERERGRYRMLVESISDAIVTIDENGRVCDWNQAAVAMFGYTESEMIGSDLAPLIGESFHTDHLSAIKSAASEDRVYNGIIERVATRKDGSTVAVLLKMTRWEDKNNVFVTGVLREHQQTIR